MRNRSQTIIQAEDKLNPESLTVLLREAGLLICGKVASIEVEAAVGPFGKSRQVFHIQAEYRNTGSSAPPSRFFLKFGKSLKEYFFYQTIAQTMTAMPLLRCYSAGYDPGTDQACLLLEDLSKTHLQTEWPLPPSADLCVQTCRLLAQIHAFWWEQPCLISEFNPVIPSGRAWADRRALALQQLPAFLSFLGDRLSPCRRAVYERLLAAPAQLGHRATSAAKLTLLHGDMHVWNVLYPNDLSGVCRIFDWNMWDIGCPTDDLAYLMAVHWYPERRCRLEQDLLRTYYQELVKCGVANYSWDELAQDYRLSIIRSLLIPAWQWVRSIHPGVWWSHLERTFLAFEDQHCADLLDQ